MEKCSCYDERYYADFSYDDPLDNTRMISTSKTKVKSVCLGTRECDECHCGGDESKCDFYEHKREAARRKETCGYDIYYAHHQWKYHTPVEGYELDLIRRYFPNAKIFNPSADLKTKSDSEEEIMKECLSTVEKSDIVVFSSLDGTVGKGVYREVLHAQNIGKLVLYIFQDSLTTDFGLYINYNGTDRTYAFVGGTK